MDAKLAEDLAAAALKSTGGGETLVIIYAQHAGLTRFSENAIHQNVSERRLDLTVQAAFGKKVGVANGTVQTPQDAAAVGARAAALARVQGEKEDYAGLAAPAPIPDAPAYDEATAAYTPAQRADAVGGIIRAAEGGGMKAAGFLSTASAALAVANSRGVFCHHPWTEARATLVVSAEDASGYAEGAAWDVGRLNLPVAAEDAIRRAELGRKPRDIKPGRYDLIVEPYAIGELFNWLAFVVFGTRAYQEGRSLLAKRMGESIMGENVTISDEPLAPEGIPIPFDLEGVPATPVTLVDRGKAVGLVYDLATGARAGKPSTGHCIGPGNADGPFPTHLTLAAGDSSVPAMIGAMERGLYVTRFHYVNGFVEPMEAVFTGMTRDGTYWVEDGKIKYGVKNLRWTESMLRAFSQVKLLSRERKFLDDGITALAPAVYFRDFTFTGTTEH